MENSSDDPISLIEGRLTEWYEWSEWSPNSTTFYWDALYDHPLIHAVIIIILSFILAFVISRIFTKVFQQLAKRSAISVDNNFSSSFKQPMFNTVFFTGAVLATNIAQLPFGKDLISKLLLSVIAISWIVAGFRMCSTFLSILTQSRHKFLLIDKQTTPILDLLIKIGIILMGSYFLLIIWGVNPFSWLASASIIGIVVGFAAKDTLANLFSGFFILADTPYKVGDYINLESGERGKVTHIGMRSTRIITRDDIEITIPNAVIANAKIINENGGSWKRIRLRLQVSVSYQSDVDEVCEVLEKIAVEHTEIVKTPEPRVRLRAFGASSLDFELLCWISDPEDKGRISHELYIQIFKTFKKYNIEIPFNQQDVHIKGSFPEPVTKQ